MRTLLHIPILHAEADMGSLAPALRQESIALWGEQRWSRHLEVVAGFWDQVSRHVLSLGPASLRVYQDGLAVDGDLGVRLLAQAASRGSPNYRLLLELVRRGAALQKTEDAELLIQERQNLMEALGDQAPAGSGLDRTVYERKRDSLMAARDRAIGETISKTLLPTETGILFLGAYHQPFPHLAADIRVRAIKDAETVRRYLQALPEQGDPAWLPLAHALTAAIQ